MPFRWPPELSFDPRRGFRIHRGVVASDWTDLNGHMNVVYYRKAFDEATQVMLRAIGLWDNDNEHGSTFALEDHVTYQHELHPGQPFFVTHQLLDHDDRLIHAFLRLYAEVGEAGAEPVLAATCEHIGIYVDMRTRRSAPMPAAFRELLDEIAGKVRGMPQPRERGRVIGIRSRSPKKAADPAR